MILFMAIVWQREFASLKKANITLNNSQTLKKGETVLSVLFCDYT
jgi:hypothetical protein